MKTFLAEGLNIVLQRSQGYFAHLPRPAESCSFIWTVWSTSFTNTLRDLGLHNDVYLFIPLLPAWLVQAILKLLQRQAAPGMLLEHDCRKQPQRHWCGEFATQTSRASESNWPCHYRIDIWYIKNIMVYTIYMDLSTLSTNHAPPKRSLYDTWWHHECQISYICASTTIKTVMKSYSQGVWGFNEQLAQWCRLSMHSRSSFIRVWLCPTLHSKGKFSLKQMRLVNLLLLVR